MKKKERKKERRRNAFCISGNNLETHLRAAAAARCLKRIRHHAARSFVRRRLYARRV